MMKALSQRGSAQLSAYDWIYRDKLQGSETRPVFSCRPATDHRKDKTYWRCMAGYDRLYVTWYGCTQDYHFFHDEGFVTVKPEGKDCFWSERHFYVAPYKGQVLQR